MGVTKRVGFVDPRKLINSSKMTWFQIQAVGVCLIVNMLDGFDILVIAFSGPSITKEFSFSSSQLGAVLSASFVGMAIGSFFLAPLADRIGRRLLTTLALVDVVVFLALTTTATGLFDLGVYRALTGLGIGAMLASLNVITAEYSSDKRRTTAIALYAVGYPIGATIGGFIAGELIVSFGWRSAFWFGAVLTAVLVIVVWFRLPESIDFLITKRPKNALLKANRLLGKMNYAPVESLPAPEPQLGSTSFQRIFTHGKWKTTLLIGLAFFILMAAFNFGTQWTPSILVSSGLSESNGISGGVLFTLGGIFGSLALGALAVRFSTKWLTVGFFVLGAPSFLLFALTIGALAPVLVAAIAIGFFTNGAMAGMYALTPTRYSTAERTTAMGFAIGVGRIGAIISPALAGVLLDLDWSPAHVYLLFIIPLVLAALATAMIKKEKRSPAAYRAVPYV